MFEGLRISGTGTYKNTLDRCLWMRRAGQWNGHAVGHMFGAVVGGLDFKNGQNSEMSCMPVPPNKKLNDQIIRQVTISNEYSVIISLRFHQANMAFLKDKRIKPEE